ncbi:DUF4123 domain-containing protein [Lysobacter sp. MMG2]|uniref:DUF4123 domain-containing protein n=1 Tax=Lysobacter sp. MMG2 TaxID=2801338 RepID=UPI001C227DD7|nr:DUF4123 domain-containing protein [Lysobacter sp. MMG2]MBU8976077.1 DUF4123 domain-containing protein [Lysobacter sp. MMG2]
MSTLRSRLNVDLVEHPQSRPALLIEAGVLSPPQCEQLHANPKVSLHPLLTQPEYTNLREHGPMLVAWDARGGDNLDELEALNSLARHALQPALCGWLVSTCPPEQLAQHLAQANRMMGPDGDDYLLRYHVPHVLDALSRRDVAWSQAFFAPLVVWWWRVPSPQDNRAAWRSHRGLARPQPVTLPPLHPDPALWSALLGDDLEAHLILHSLEQFTPSVFAVDCPGERLSQVAHLLSQVSVHGLTREEDRFDYVLWCLTQPAAPERLPRWPQALAAAQAGGARLAQTLMTMN